MKHLLAVCCLALAGCGPPRLWSMQCEFVEARALFGGSQEDAGWQRPTYHECPLQLALRGRTLSGTWHCNERELDLQFEPVLGRTAVSGNVVALANRADTVAVAEVWAVSFPQEQVLVTVTSTDIDHSTDVTASLDVGLRIDGSGGDGTSHQCSTSGDDCTATDSCAGGHQRFRSHTLGLEPYRCEGAFVRRLDHDVDGAAQPREEEHKTLR